MKTVLVIGLTLRRIVLVVAIANLVYFFVEFVVARRIGSVSLFADSIDFLEDAALYFLIVLATGWTVYWRSCLGLALAVLIALPRAAFLSARNDVFNPPPSALPPELDSADNSSAPRRFTRVTAGGSRIAAVGPRRLHRPLHRRGTRPTSDVALAPDFRAKSTRCSP